MKAREGCRLPSHMGHKSSPEATCKGKEQYDRATANRIARKTKKLNLLTYLCPFCGHWHVGQHMRMR